MRIRPVAQFQMSSRFDGFQAADEHSLEGERIVARVIGDIWHRMGATVVSPYRRIDGQWRFSIDYQGRIYLNELEAYEFYNLIMRPTAFYSHPNIHLNSLFLYLLMRLGDLMARDNRLANLRWVDGQDWGTDAKGFRWPVMEA